MKVSPIELSVDYSGFTQAVSLYILWLHQSELFVIFRILCNDGKVWFDAKMQ